MTSCTVAPEPAAIGCALGELLAAAVLLSSCIQFCRTDAKTEDHYFLGFPSYWNVVAFYAIVLGVGTTGVGIALAVLTVLVFVPVKYVYPSRTKLLRSVNLGLAAVWLAASAVLVVQYPDPNPLVVVLSMVYLAYYFGVSIWLTVAGSRRAGSAEGVERAG